LFASALSIYEIVEECASAADDQHLGFGIGQTLDLAQWEPIAKAIEEAETVGDLLRYFVVHALEHTSSTEFFVRTEGERTTFGFKRIVVPTFSPSQNDAFYFGFFARLLQHATGPYWDASKVLARVALPDAIPWNSDLPRLAQGDDSGMRISFPTEWQFAKLRKSSFATMYAVQPGEHLPESLIASVRAALRPHMHKPDLTVEKAAKICGFEKRSLARRLRKYGTTIIKEVSAVRFDWAQDKLTNTHMKIAEIGVSVGFNDPTVFSRAFKNWTGQSPREFRRNNRV
jgi:AraC-like DNA-binding protein